MISMHIKKFVINEYFHNFKHIIISDNLPRKVEIKAFNVMKF